MNDAFWQTKLHARLHDPAEKALVLLRDPAGHEGGTSRWLHRELGFDQLPAGDRLDHDNADVLAGVLFRKGIPASMYRAVKRADWWASAADRPQWPTEEITVPAGAGQKETRRIIPSGTQVRWTKKPILIHPLNGEAINLRTLAETDITDIKQRSFNHFKSLIARNGDAVDWRRTALAFWRFGPELSEDEDNGKLGLLWPLLPADTRVPDHSIWDHLDLTSAFAGAFGPDGEGDPALLTVAMGPVQGFIAAARTTSDLWAGSHLLSRLMWEAARVVCERLGPDAILFPRLRGLPQVDLWLRDQMGLDKALFNDCDWTRSATDSNPLFSAALPNRFVAVVPARQAAEIANEVREKTRNWMQELGREVVERLVEAADIEVGPQVHAYEQMQRQLDEFPEIHWAAVRFSLVEARDKNRDTDLDTGALAAAMQPFHGDGDGDKTAPGFLDSPAWQTLRHGGELEGVKFFPPNPGVLYPAIQELGERVLAATKAVRAFGQLEQHGWRCSLAGETEWLTADRSQLDRSYRGNSDTLWARIAKKKPAWAKEGEHLGALPAIKRLWPDLFAEEVAQAKESRSDVARRFVVSTHTMAMASDLKQLQEAIEKEGEDQWSELISPQDQSPALPKKLACLRKKTAARVLAALERTREDTDQQPFEKLEKKIERAVGRKPETYYALLLFDGDHMGRILSGDCEESAISYKESFHPEIRPGFNNLAESHSAIDKYGKEKRAVSPNRHLAISSALNDFALHVVPHVVEQEHHGRVIYAGGDDVLAMLPVADLLDVMTRLREAYSGGGLGESGKGDADWREVRRDRKKLACSQGFAYLNNRLMRMMGGATASCGAVIAHHRSPLNAVLRELRNSEQRAKKQGGRNAFSLTVMKRAGGELRLTAKWDETISVIEQLRKFLAPEAVSRRAVYNSLAWLRDLPADADEEMLGSLLGHQLDRQSRGRTGGSDDPFDLAKLLASLALLRENNERSLDWLTNLMSIAEFLARETRTGGLDEKERATS